MPNLEHTLLQIYRMLLEAEDAYQLLPEILDLVMLGTNAEIGQIELYDETGERRFRRVRKSGKDLEDRRESKISDKILAWVKANNEVVLSANAKRDFRFHDSTTVVGQNVLSVVCAPLRDKQGVFGVLYLDNRNREALFNEETKKLVGELANRLAEPLQKRLAQYDERKRMSRELQHARDRELGYLEIIGTSPAIQAVLEKIEAGKEHDDNVLLLGESGTGKELIARLLHRSSGRSEKNFVPFDCSSVPEDILISELFGHERGAFTGAVQRQHGLVEKAEGGTLFLDEIGNLSPRVQAMLLRFLDHKQYRRLGTGEEKKADVRLMFATNGDLAALVQKREFRNDLLFRLKRGIVLHVPPLRERREDIPLLAEFLLKKYNLERKARISFSAEARAGMSHYAYPGNIRELEAFVYDAARAAHRMKQETIQLMHLPSELLAGSMLPKNGTASGPFKLSAHEYYAQYLPKEFQDRPFIWAAENHGMNGAPQPHELHEQLLIAINPVPGVPLKFASRAVLHAFERNVLLALLRQTQGKQNEAIKLARINKSAFINKMKRHGINLKKNQFEKGEDA